MSEAQKKLGKYAILGVAGRGGMGTVYRGHDPVIDRKVAVKVYTASEVEFGSEIAQKMFLNEAQVVGALDHPNILRIYDAGNFKGRPYIAMEYVEGLRTLGPYCKADELLPMESVIRIVAKCAKALDYAHRNGVTHRDIKPDNIMLTTDDEVKVVDFGVAEHKNKRSDDSFQIVGTPTYMSPEQVRGEELAGQSDIYSLGVILYQLLTGNVPFKAPGLAALSILITTKNPKPVRERRADIPVELEAIVTRAMAKKLDERYKTGEEMAADLAAIHQQVARAGVALSPEEQFDTARALTFFKYFTEPELNQLLGAATWEHFPAGDFLMKEGAREEALYVLVSGEVAVELDGCMVCTLSQGECVGELAYFSDEAHTATVVARNNVSAMKFEIPISKWGSIPVQMRFNSAFQKTLVERLERTTRELGKFIKEAARQSA
ncbi:MAG: serine/threonine-protein kinase [Gammaproteobacteria bacterium]|nr:serine/threonine-protein kinase [Gammaproteobacteria bacterium]MDX2461215.1 serine/threonine-protein kinase [Gammaproteobacteria bacterium]